MVTRYSRLRSAIAMLAADPQAQVDYLDALLAPLTGGVSAEAYGNVELIETFGDIVLARDHMLQCGELTPDEFEEIMRLDRAVDEFCANQDENLWTRTALFSNDRWQQLRVAASATLSTLPDAVRESDYTRSLGNGS